MIKIVESVGYRIVSRFLPTITAAAKECNCQPGESWCQSSAVRCRCAGNCISVVCICPFGGCR
jgi:hypothetical protein